jgi:hypothetical protein
LYNRVDGIHSAWESNEERIALRAHHAPIVRFARLAQKLLVLREQGCEFLAQLLQESRRAFDVSK